MPLIHLWGQLLFLGIGNIRKQLLELVENTGIPCTGEETACPGIQDDLAEPAAEPPADDPREEGMVP